VGGCARLGGAGCARVCVRLRVGGQEVASGAEVGGKVNRFEI
jgi:hypothetical protein